MVSSQKIDFESVLSLTGVLIGKLGGTGLECEALKLCQKETDVKLYPLNLPWLLDLVLVTVGTTDLYLVEYLSSGAGQPGWEIVCLIANLEVTDECTSNEAKPGFDDVQNMTPVDLLGIFSLTELEEAGVQAHCSRSGANTGLVTGEGLTFGPEELALQVSG
jgi:hypothetical protein